MAGQDCKRSAPPRVDRWGVALPGIASHRRASPLYQTTASLSARIGVLDTPTVLLSARLAQMRPRLTIAETGVHLRINETAVLCSSQPRLLSSAGVRTLDRFPAAGAFAHRVAPARIAIGAKAA